MSLARPCKRLRLLAPPSYPAIVALPSHLPRLVHVSRRQYTRASTITARRDGRTKPVSRRSARILTEILAKPKLSLSAAAPEVPATAASKPEKLMVNGQEVDPETNPVLANYLKSQPKPKSQSATARARETLKSQPASAIPGSGALAPSSIFEMERQDRLKTELEQARTWATPSQAEDAPADEPHDRDPEAMQARLNPKPKPRRLWMRKMVIREIQRGGWLTREQLLQRTERFNLSKSPFYRTSVKKLGMLARQIQGKPLDAALTQMRYSRKKVAQQVFKHLEASRDEATVRKGMGLGGATTEKGDPVVIRLKNGEKHRIADRSKMYIDQAWVGRGPYGKDIDYRARGRSNIMRLPQTSLTVLLKEEATRVREHEERVEKSKKRKIWVPLPDRPLHTQRQYYCW